MEVIAIASYPAESIQNSGGAPVSLLKDRSVSVQVTGLTQADLEDKTLEFRMVVQANNTSVGTGGWYTIQDDTTTLGTAGHIDGLFHPPGFRFNQTDAPTDAQRLRLLVKCNQTKTWGANVTVI